MVLDKALGIHRVLGSKLKPRVESGLFDASPKKLSVVTSLMQQYLPCTTLASAWPIRRDEISMVIFLSTAPGHTEITNLK